MRKNNNSVDDFILHWPITAAPHLRGQNTDDVIPVRNSELKKETVNKAVNVSGYFTTNNETYLSFKTGGIIKSIFVNEGDRVKKISCLQYLN